MESLNAFLGALTALLVALTALIPVLIKLWRRDNLTDERLDVWAKALLRRGTAGANRKLKHPKEACPMIPGLTTQEFVIRPEVREAYRPIVPFLQSLRRDNPGITRERFAERLESVLGNWLVIHICDVYEVSDFECHDVAWEMSELPADPSAPAL